LLLLPFINSPRRCSFRPAAFVKSDANSLRLLTTSLAEERCRASAASRASAESGDDDNERSDDDCPTTLARCSWPPPPLAGAAAATAVPPELARGIVSGRWEKERERKELLSWRGSAEGV